MSAAPRDANLHAARVYMVQARHARFAGHRGWAATLLTWAGNRRREAMMDDEARRVLAEARARNPFLNAVYRIDGKLTVMGCVAAADRMRAVDGFTASECHLALDVPGLQKTVRMKIEARLRRLAREAKP